MEAKAKSIYLFNGRHQCMYVPRALRYLLLLIIAVKVKGEVYSIDIL